MESWFRSKHHRYLITFALECIHLGILGNIPLPLKWRAPLILRSVAHCVVRKALSDNNWKRSACTSLSSLLDLVVSIWILRESVHTGPWLTSISPRSSGRSDPPNRDCLRSGSFALPHYKVELVKRFRIGIVKYNWEWCLLEIGNPLPQSMEIEIVSNVVFVDFYEKLVALKIAEPLNPAGARLAIIFVIQAF